MPFFTFLISFHSLLVLLSAGAGASANASSMAMGPSPPPTPAALKPGIAAVVGIVTTMFSITFLVLLYVKHCKGSMNSVSGGRGYPPDSGMNRKVIWSLPMFRFSSLRGQKEGLECAVCLSRFEAEEVLRLLPKCKHAFHVECVDTWLEAHSTCPLCRCRVDPEDVLLATPTPPRARRVSGRHSSAGERGTALQIIADMGRASLDSFNYSRRGARKDGLLPVKEDTHRLHHRIIISAGDGDGEEVRRWSDVQPADFLYLKSEMLLGLGEGEGSGSAVINGRSVSEITGMSRYRGNNGGKEERERQEQGVVKRWLAWISHHNPPVQSATPPHIVL